MTTNEKKEENKPLPLGGSQGFIPPGLGVERHLRTYGHLPERGCCPHDQPKNEDFCHCGHGRTMHAKIPFNPNYTEGRCCWKDCPCQYFCMPKVLAPLETGGWEKELEKTWNLVMKGCGVGYGKSQIWLKDFIRSLITYTTKQTTRKVLKDLFEFSEEAEKSKDGLYSSEIEEYAKSKGISLSEHAVKKK